MEFNFSPEEESFRGELREFLKQELPDDWSGADDIACCHAMYMTIGL